VYAILFLQVIRYNNIALHPGEVTMPFIPANNTCSLCDPKSDGTTPPCSKHVDEIRARAGRDHIDAVTAWSLLLFDALGAA
jgi:hypothetical protein